MGLLNRLLRLLPRRLGPAPPGLTPNSTTAEGELDDPRKLALEERVQLLEDKAAFLTFEVSKLRKTVRHLAAAMLDRLPFRQPTYDSFDFQWKSLPDGRSMLSNPDFRRQVPDLVSRYTQLPREWFNGKEVLDAGCGQGRFSYGLCALGAHVLAADQSASAIEQTRRNCLEFADRIEVIQADLLQPLPVDRQFDLVWSFGVLHHTGDTYRAFRNVSSRVKPGGHLFVMIYGEPRLHQGEEYRYYAEMEHWRRRLRNRPFQERVDILRRALPAEDVHGYFDAISPETNDIYSLDELEGWFLEAGFQDLKRTMDHPNHFLIARRP